MLVDGVSGHAATVEALILPAGYRNGHSVQELTGTVRDRLPVVAAYHPPNLGPERPLGPAGCTVRARLLPVKHFYEQ